jgi:hypothetical protein
MEQVHHRGVHDPVIHPSSASVCPSWVKSGDGVSSCRENTEYRPMLTADLDRVKVLKEVEVENRFHGTIGYFEVSFPLGA